MVSEDKVETREEVAEQEGSSTLEESSTSGLRPPPEAASEQAPSLSSDEGQEEEAAEGEDTGSGDAEPSEAEDVDEEPSGSTDPNIGRTLGGRYVIEQRIGRGGMGLVYLAEQRGLRRKVVVKLLARDPEVESATSRERFEREAQALSLLNHPHIVGVHDFGRDEDEDSYIVMEYVDGVRLDTLVRREGGLPLEVFLAIAQQTLDAVGDAHEQGLIHRDLKPSNVMLTERKGNPYYVKVLDFGLAKLIEEDSDLTGKHSLVGSLSYLSPEQILGQEVDQRADVYSLGVLFYYILAARKPFLGRDTRVLYQHIHEEADRLDEVLPEGHGIPDELIELIHRCLSKDPSGRPSDANALLRELHALIDPSLLSNIPWGSGEFSSPSWSGARTLGLGASSEASNDSGKLVRPVLDTGQGRAIAREPSSPSHSDISQRAQVIRDDSVDEDSLPLLDVAVREPGAERKWVVPVVVVAIIAAAAAFAFSQVGGESSDSAPDSGAPEEVAGAAMGSTRGASDAAPKEPAPSAGGEQAPAGGDAARAAPAEPEDQAESPSPARFELKARRPDKVEVFVDGKSRGETPLTLELPAGGYALSARSDGYEEWSLDVSAEEGAVREIVIELDPIERGGARASKKRVPRGGRKAPVRGDREERRAPEEDAPSEPPAEAREGEGARELAEEGGSQKSTKGDGDDIKMLEFDSKKKNSGAKKKSEFELLNVD